MQPELTIELEETSVDQMRISRSMAQRMTEELSAQRKIIANLLRHAGTPGVCKGQTCKAEIVFVFHRDTGKYTPYNADGTSHFATCPDRSQFHRGRNDAANNRD
jgi:hypothetical protein